MATLNGRVPNSATREAILGSTGNETGHAAIEALRGLTVKSSALATEVNLGISGFQTGITENHFLCLNRDFQRKVFKDLTEHTSRIFQKLRYLTPLNSAACPIDSR